jgi:hypothetical protein
MRSPSISVVERSMACFLASETASVGLRICAGAGPNAVTASSSNDVSWKEGDSALGAAAAAIILDSVAVAVVLVVLVVVLVVVIEVRFATAPLLGRTPTTTTSQLARPNTPRGRHMGLAIGRRRRRVNGESFSHRATNVTRARAARRPRYFGMAQFCAPAAGR